MRKMTGLFLLWILPLCASSGAFAQPFRSPAEPVAPNVSFSGGDGSSIDAAIVIVAKDEMSGVRAEHQWLRDHLPGAKLGRQALRNEQGRMYDYFQLILPDGEAKELYFDITSYFGKIGNLSQMQKSPLPRAAG